MGELKLESVHSDGTRTELFHNDVSEDAWKEYEVTLPKEDFTYHVRKVTFRLRITCGMQVYVITWHALNVIFEQFYVILILRSNC